MTGQEQLDLQQDLFNIYSGILFNFPSFASGEPADLTYDFHCPEYKTLLEKYPVAQIAGEGGDFERARDALHLLEFSYEQPDLGIN